MAVQCACAWLLDFDQFEFFFFLCLFSRQTTRALLSMDLTSAHSERNAKGATGKTATKGEDSDSRSNNVRAVVFMGLLALQIGVQPVLVSECIDKEQVWAVVHFSPARTLLRASCAPCMNGFFPRLVSPQVVDGKRPVDII